MRKRSLSLLVLVSLAACGGGRSAALPPGGGQPNGRVSASFVITVPRASGSAGAAARRAPRYVSPAMQSLGVTVDAGTPNQSVSTQNIGPGDPGCNTPSPTAPLTCTLQIAVAPGPHTFDFRTYDGRLDGGGVPQGSLLSANLGFPFTIQQGQSNSFRLVMQGVPAGVAVLAAPNADMRGDASGGFDLYGAYQADGTTFFPRTFTVVATDADGNFIVGPGAPALSLTSSNTAQLSSGVAAASNPNQFTVTPAGASTSSAIELTATATPSSAADANSGAAPVSVNIPVRYAARNAPRIYLSGGPGQNWIKVYDEHGNQLTGLSGTFPNLSGPTGLGYDRAGDRVFAANYSNGTVTAYTSDGTQVPLATPIARTNPTAVAYDSSADRIYVATHDLGLFVYDTSGNPIAVSGDWKVPASPRGPGGSLPYDPTALLIDGRGSASRGNVYTNDISSASFVVYDPNGNAVDSFSSDNGGAGLAQDPLSGRLFGSWTAHGVTVYDGDSHAVVPVPGSWPRTAQPNAIAFNPANGLLYVYDTDAQAFGYTDNVTVYDPNGNPVATPGTFAGAGNGWGMTIVP